MEVKIEKKDIQSALKAVMPLANAAKKSTLSGIRVMARGEKLILEASTETAGISMQVDADILEEGWCVVDEYSFAGAIDGVKGSVCVSTGRDMVFIDDGTTRAQMPVKTQEMASMDTAHDAGIKVCGIDSILTSCAPFASKGSARPEFAGVCMRPKDGKMTAIATNGHCLAMVDSSEPWFDSDAIIPMDVVAILRKKEWGGEIDVWRNGQNIFFFNGAATLRTACIAGRFPDIQKVVTESYNTKIKVDREYFINALKSASGFAPKVCGAVRFGLDKNKNEMNIKSFSEKGEFTTRIDAYTEGENITFCAAWMYMQTAANLCDGSWVYIRVIDNDSPIVIRGESIDTTFVVMPVQLYFLQVRK